MKTPDTNGRRQFLRMSVGSTLGIGLLTIPLHTLAAPESQYRQLRLFNTHTQEELDVLYCENGIYNPDCLASLDHHLRDHRENEEIRMDKQLFDQMWSLQQLTGGDSYFEIISGYRSPKTNAMLNSKSSKVARKSYHLQGRAIDLRLRNTPLKDLHQLALSMQAGGVGYYPKSDFIHLDTGPVRSW